MAGSFPHHAQYAICQLVCIATLTGGNLLGAESTPSPRIPTNPWQSTIPETGSLDLDELFPPPETGDDDTPQASPDRLTPAEKCRELLNLLKPEAGRYASLTRLDNLVSWGGPEDAFDLAQARQINLSLLAYVAFHARTLTKEKPDRRLRAHLEHLTTVSHAHWFLESVLEKHPEFALELESKPAAAGLGISKFWRNESSPHSPAWQDEYGDRTIGGDNLYCVSTDTQSAGPQLLELNLTNGSLRKQKLEIPGRSNNDLSLDVKPLVEAGRMFVPFDGVAYKKWGEPSWQSATLKYKFLYGDLATWKDGLVFAWTPPPHYFSGLEDPGLAKDPDYLAGINSSLHVMSPGEKEFKQVPASSSLKFLNEGDDTIKEMFVIEPGRVVVVMEERYPSPREPLPPDKIYVSAPHSITEFKHCANVPRSWTVRPWPGRPQHLLAIVSRPGTEFLHDLEEPQPEQVLSYDLENGKWTRLLKMDSRQVFTRPWGRGIPKEPSGARWSLPADMNPPEPAVALEWISIFGHGSDLFAFCSRTKVGAQLTPDYELLIFSADRPAPARVPLHFVLPGEVKQDLIKAAAIKQSPSRADELNPIPMPADNHLAFDTYYGVFWVGWKEIAAAAR